MSAKYRLATFLRSVVLYTTRKALPGLNPTNKLRLSRWNSVGASARDISSSQHGGKGRGRCRGKPGLLFFTSEVCSLQAASTLQMQQPKGTRPPLPSPELQSCTGAFDYFFISCSSLPSIRSPLTNQAALGGRTPVHASLHSRSRCRLSQHREVACPHTWVPLGGVL